MCSQETVYPKSQQDFEFKSMFGDGSGYAEEITMFLKPIKQAGDRGY